MSIDVWLIVIALLNFAVPLIAITSDNSRYTLTRSGLWIWTAVFIALALVSKILEELPGDVSSSDFVEGVYWLGVVIIAWVAARRLLWRVRDAGWPEGWSYLFVFPVINVLFWFVMLFVPPKRWGT